MVRIEYRFSLSRQWKVRNVEMDAQHSSAALFMKGPLVFCTLERIKCDHVTGKD